MADPADDFAALVTEASPEAVDSVLEAYAHARVERPDQHLVRRARLAGELRLVTLAAGRHRPRRRPGRRRGPAPRGCAGWTSTPPDAPADRAAGRALHGARRSPVPPCRRSSSRMGRPGARAVAEHRRRPTPPRRTPADAVPTDEPVRPATGAGPPPTTAAPTGEAPQGVAADDPEQPAPTPRTGRRAGCAATRRRRQAGSTADRPARTTGRRPRRPRRRALPPASRRLGATDAERTTTSPSRSPSSTRHRSSTRS